jgi:hypothetical protein
LSIIVTFEEIARRALQESLDMNNPKGGKGVVMSLSSFTHEHVSAEDTAVVPT